MMQLLGVTELSQLDRSYVSRAIFEPWVPIAHLQYILGQHQSSREYDVLGPLVLVDSNIFSSGMLMYMWTDTQEVLVCVEIWASRIVLRAIGPQLGAHS
jgi:hypothetical protein